MRLDQFTVKAQEAITAAQALAQRYGHQQLEAMHVLSALMEDGEGIPVAVLRKVGGNVDALRAQVDRELRGKPVVRGGDGVYIAAALEQVLRKAEEEMRALRDEYISTEHVLLALPADRDLRANTCGAGREARQHTAGAQGCAERSAPPRPMPKKAIRR